MDYKERFISLCEKIERDGIDDLMKWLESNGFYESPASSKYHGAHSGGLCEHSLNVYDEMQRLLAAYPEVVVPEESVIIASLFHDLCKVNMYVSEKRNRKNPETNAWESYDAFSIKEKFCFGGHGSKSVFLIQHFIKLTPEEAVAINCHMSCWQGDTSVGSAYEQFHFAWLLHVADEGATYIRESKERYN